MIGAAVVVLAAVAIGLFIGSRPLPAPPTQAPAASPSPSPSVNERSALAGLRVVLDPGHNGGNAAAPAEMAQQVDNGRGGRKHCNTAGTSTAGGYPEHAFAWDVAQRTRDLLQAAGAEVTLTRDDDTGVGPCVDVRGRSAQEHDADVLVSLHADGADNPEVAGYFAIVSDPPLNDAQGQPTRELATALLDALGQAGFAPSSSYPGALSERPDLATLNLAERPAVLLELAEMRNPEEAAVAESPEGRQRYAQAVVDGLERWAADRG
ncbi:N-acetylmuramoyl-L-alanine amidase [Georgenia thermotolerans]|nr:N-acetylmuramoyl-L-alanine amidase [Georgenia thermotolerans]